MAAKINTLNINGKQVSWSHTRLVLDGDLFDGFTSVAWDESTEVTTAYAATKDHAPVAFTEGKYVPGDLKIKGPVHAIAELRDWWAAKSADGRSYGTVHLNNAQMQWDLGAGTAEQRVEWETLKWTGNSNSNEENPDPREEEITIKFLKCRRNGKTLYNSADEVTG
jgi:hypothetical protein